MISRGTEWRRWEPHIHGPGTLLNDQFKGPVAWKNYIQALEDCTPTIEALAVTDYYTTDVYEEVLSWKLSGRLPNVQLLFPNIEVRLDVAAKQGFVNLHLLVSPEDSNHLVEVQRLLSQLTFSAHGDRFNCTKADLERLGQATDPAIQDSRTAIALGATQFKVSFDQLRKAFADMAWARENILIAVAGAAGDGTSGLQQAADMTIRAEIEKFADVIFSSSPAQRQFWIGKGRATAQHLRDRYSGCKPCLHGSDAHGPASVGRPNEDRFCWVKGALTFDALRQACIDPEARAYVGIEPPKSAMPSQVIDLVKVDDAPWAPGNAIPLNPGLVAIIGARGSGKTALADVIAAGCGAIPETSWAEGEEVSPSFLARARPLIGDARVTLKWCSGDPTQRYLDGRDASSWDARARYLSQQFVEELCSSSGASEGLVREIERVIFEAHSGAEEEGAYSFEELREQRTGRFQVARGNEVDAISALSDRIAEELEKEALVEALSAQVTAKEKVIAGYNTDLQKLVTKGAQEKIARHTALTEAIQMLTTKVNALAARRRTFLAMQDEVKNTRTTKAPEMLRQAMSKHQSSGMSAPQWDAFLLDYKGDVDGDLTHYLAWVDGEVVKLNGVAPAPKADPAVPFIATDADLGALPMAVLKAEAIRLELHISADTAVRNQYTALSKKIATEKATLQTLKLRRDDAKGAEARRKALQQDRDAAYGRLFEAVIAEQAALSELYGPLMERLAMADGTLKKLSFRVMRVADIVAWAGVGEEELIDCRKGGEFNGRGSLEKLARKELRAAWETGSAAEVQTAMTQFIADHYKALRAQAPAAIADQEAFRRWSKQFAHWLFGTDHISVRYEILYDGIDIRKLSPGTRGIVLLLLYLALDDTDDRPLIIDQPEENLDPKSVFDELVLLFIAAKSKRQVIMVTHNANLVINTDADQIIVATAGHSDGVGLPTFSYVAGGLEDAHIRRSVCDILEGGDEAFRERARRLRVRIER